MLMPALVEAALESLAVEQIRPCAGRCADGVLGRCGVGRRRDGDLNGLAVRNGQRLGERERYATRDQPHLGRPGRDALLEAIADEEARLARLSTEQADSRRRLAALRAELAALGAGPEIRVPLPFAVDTPAPRTPADKVKLFRALFRGREDVFPTRFVSKKTGKPGYAPACGNKFVRGVCELPKVKCGDCTNQAFTPVDDTAVIGHLTGRHVMGVYPLLEDETCWFLAVDFDKKTWTEDVSAFAEICRRMGLPAAVERSRSGEGAHVWFFFSSPVPATTARKMGCHLITETMSRRHQLSMDSYDRLFPSQDTMPRGGFGNLIALPLQHGPRKNGNSVFLDENLQPRPDDEQWAFLASVPRIDPAVVEAIAREAARQGSVIGVRMADMAGEGEAAPWTRLPSRSPRPVVIAEPLPLTVRAVPAKASTTRGSTRSFFRCRCRGRGRWSSTQAAYTDPAKKEVRIFDYVDREVPMLLRMFEKRLRGYRSIGYARGESPLGFAEPRDEIIVEYDQDDQDALRSIEGTDEFA
jgi:hypothetical protein